MNDRTQKICSCLTCGVMAAVVGYCLMVLGADWFARTYFGITIDGDWFLLLTASGADELRAFWSAYWKGIVSTLVVVAALWALCIAAICRWPKWALAAFAAGVAFLAIGGPSRIASFKPVYFAWDTMLRFGEYRHLASVVSAERKTPRPPLRESGRNRLVIIGESLTSRRMGVYGYPKDTTPQLARLVAEGRLEVRPERRVASPYTARALMSAMLDAEHTQVWRDRADGYRTVLVSAQDRWGRYNGGVQLLFEGCDEKVYIRHEGQPVYDEELIPEVKKAIEGPSPWIVYVHMVGSHFLPGDRVPPAFRAAESAGTAGFDDYDWSVRYTDSVVAQLVNLVPSAEVRFTSDHGESANAGRWRDPSDEALWVVPEIVSPATNVVSEIREANGSAR